VTGGADDRTAAHTAAHKRPGNSLKSQSKDGNIRYLVSREDPVYRLHTCSHLQVLRIVLQIELLVFSSQILPSPSLTLEITQAAYPRTILTPCTWSSVISLLSRSSICEACRILSTRSHILRKKAQWKELSEIVN